MKRIGAMLSALVSVFLLAPTILWPTPAAGEGALAIGLPSDVAESGFAYGVSVNYPTRDEAARRALEYCRTAKAASDAATSLCSVVDIFRGQCVAVAMDPQDGTPGVGWSIGVNRQNAEIQALSRCTSTEGVSRRGACRVTSSMCDGS
jgi:hypothetical protein